MQITLKQLTDEMNDVIGSHPMIRQSTVTTYDEMLIRVSELKNEYFGAFLIYDLRQSTLGEWSTTIPFTLVFCDKLRPNRVNEIYVHSNTFSLAIDTVKKLRQWCVDRGIDGLNDVLLDVWSEDESDSDLGGTKIDFTMNIDIGGYCDYPES